MLVQPPRPQQLARYVPVLCTDTAHHAVATCIEKHRNTRDAMPVNMHKPVAIGLCRFAATLGAPEDLLFGSHA
jgi:hypothetical protein